MSVARPERWVGLGFVATIENAPGEVLTQIDGIESVAAQVVWGMDPQKPSLMADYLEDLAENDLKPVGWGWCHASDTRGAAAEGKRHAEIVQELGLLDYIANMEEPYDAHGDQSHPRFHMPDAYFEAFRDVLPNVELAVTTTPRWASNHGACQLAGCVLMGQAFSEEVKSPPGPATVAACVAFGKEWGWRESHMRPLVQVYHTNDVVPDPDVYLRESAACNVGVVPYILEQALSGAGRISLAKLEPAIQRQPAGGWKPAELPDGPDYRPPEDLMAKIGTQHGITAFINWVQKQPGVPVDQPPNYDPTKPGTWPWPERLERTLNMLREDHDARN